jgi:phosphoglucosamine mutase
VNRLFGTDGIRGVANRDLTPELAFAVGRAAAAVIAGRADPLKPIVIGRDTRCSGTMLEAAMVAGITSIGRNVVQLGIVPTPAVAAIALHADAAAGVMISASHNPIEDNGIKFFGADGFKLSDALEDEIAARVDDSSLPRPTHDGVGVASHARGLIDRYMVMLWEAGASLAGWTVVVDAAHGAAYHVAPAILRRLGATVVAINADDDGTLVNVDCGATNLRALQDAAAAARDGGGRVVGVAFDGDADRALFVDEAGAVLDGDATLLALARERKARGELPQDAVVATVMSNVGLERALADEGIALRRAPVGDRYVLEAMRAEGLVLGGEQSGHVIDLGRNTTGDGPMTAVLLFSAAARASTTLAALAAGLTVYPQVLVNVPVDDRGVAGAPAVRAAVAAAERSLGRDGRVLVRPSGTESLVRVMVEGPDDPTIRAIADEIAAAVRAAARTA